jgi:outer membrane protein assembly factor BamB
VRGLAFCLLAPLFFSCAALKPSADRKPEPLLRRGWSYAENSSGLFAIDAGVTPVSYSGPVLAGEKLLFGSDRFGLVAVAKKTGQVLWKKNVAEGVTALPFVLDGKVIVGSGSGQLAQFSVDGGQEGWAVNLGAPVHGSMAFAFDRLFVATADEAVHGIDPSTGKVLWTYRRPSFSGTSIRGGGNPSIVAGKIWLGFSDGSLVSLDPQTGALEFERLYRDNLKFMDLDAKVVGWKEGLLVSTYDGKLRHIKRDGTLLWEFPAGGARAPLVAEGDVIYVPSSDGTVVALAGATGKEIWRHALRRGVPTSLAVVKKEGKTLLLVSGSEERLQVLNATSGKLESESSFGRGSGSYAPIAVDAEFGTFYVLSSYSRLYQFHLNL